MGEPGFVRFPATLDPRAEEFRPTFSYPTPPQFYFPYHTPPFLQYAHVLPPQAYVSNPPPPAYFSNSPPPIHFSTSLPAYLSSSHPPAYVSSSHQAYVSSSHQAYVGNSQSYFCSSPPAHVSDPSTAHFSSSPPAHVSGSSSGPTHFSRPPMEATRTIVLASVPRGASETEVRKELELFGDVRAVQMERARREGIVTVHFYDLRHAVEAAREIHMQHNSGAARGVVFGGAVWAQFATPYMAGVPDGYNQGTLVVFNLNPNFSDKSLMELFQPFGDVKELRETPMKRHQRFVEFYDIRDAAKAYSQINGKEVCGNQIVIEFSRPGGYKKLFQKNISKNPNFRAQNPPLLRQNLYNSQTRKPSPQGSSNGSEKCFQKQKLKKEKQVESGSRKPMHKNKGWSCKGRHPRCLDSRFLINEDGIVDSSVSDLRTTVMIKNIPNKYSQKLLMNMLDNHCIRCNEEIVCSGRDEPLSFYDFVYLPIDFINKCNVGYGFVNMTSPMAALRLYKSFHHQTWEVYNSKKICEVTYARLQGLEALKEHFRNSKFPCAAEEYLPVVFSPPRDGRQLTDPLPVAARAVSLSSSNKEEDTTSSSRQTLTADDTDGDSSQ